MSTAETCNASSFQDSHSQYFLHASICTKMEPLKNVWQFTQKNGVLQFERDLRVNPKALHVKTALNNDMLMLAL